MPVMLDEVVEWLVTDKAGTYVDGTLGGGGHSKALLELVAPAGGHVIGVDRDTDALQSAGDRLRGHVDSGHFTPVRSNFGALDDALRAVRGRLPGNDDSDGGPFLDGLLLDLGVSSHQIDEATRGFSFMRDGEGGRVRIICLHRLPGLLSDPSRHSRHSLHTPHPRARTAGHADGPRASSLHG